MKKILPGGKLPGGKIVIHNMIEKLKEMKHSVSVILINEEGLVLLVTRKDDHEDWGLIGGKRDPEDEELAEKWASTIKDPNMLAAIRETKEETGIDAFNLVEVLSMHKDGYYSHTYLAEYKGEINYDKDKEPHLVEWKPFCHAMEGTFGTWNQLVLESLNSMGIFPVVIDGPTQRHPFSEF